MKCVKKLVFMGVLIFSGWIFVRAEEPADVEWKKEMERKIDILTREIEQNKLGEAASDPIYKSAFGLAPAASKVYHIDRGVSVGGYGEMVFQGFDSEKDDGSSSGKKDELDFLRAVLYFGHKFSDKILFNSEIEYEHASTSAGDGKTARGEVSLEFAYLDFMPWKSIGFRTGLLLIPVGIINEMHEPTTFHGSRRPNVEQSIIPTTWRENGAGVFGQSGAINYRAYVVAGLQAVKGSSTDPVTGFSSSSALRNGRSKGAKSTAEDLAVVGRVDYEGFPGMVFGISAYSGNSGQDAKDASNNEIEGRVSLWEIHGLGEYRGFEFRGLYSEIRLDDVVDLNEAQGVTPGSNNSIGEEMFGGYCEVAYDILPLFGSKQYLAPFIRWERYDTQQKVPSGYSRNPANNRTETTFGLTFKPHPNTVIKVDIQNMDNQAGTGVDQFNAAVGYHF